MVWQREVLGLKLAEVATNLNVDVSTVYRINKLFYNTGCVIKHPYPRDKRPTKKLTEAPPPIKEPYLYLRELKTRLLSITGYDISPTALCGYFKEMNFSRKMMAKQRDEQL